MLTFGVIVEGVFDEAAFPEFIRKCMSSHVKIIVRVCKSKKQLLRTFPGYLEGFRHDRSGLPVSKALVICDADNQPPDTVMAEMRAKYTFRQYPFPIEPIVIVQELETWLLADHEALTAVCNRAIQAVSGDLEVLRDPKLRLRQLLSAVRVAYTPRIASKIAAAASLAHLETRCPSFRRFHQILCASLVQLT